MIQAHQRRQARELDAMAWLVAHLLVGGGTLRPGTRVDHLMRDLLGREPGTVPGQTPPRPETPPPAPSDGALSVEATVAYLGAWVTAVGGKDLRPRA